MEHCSVQRGHLHRIIALVRCPLQRPGPTKMKSRRGFVCVQHILIPASGSHPCPSCSVCTARHSLRHAVLRNHALASLLMAAREPGPHKVKACSVTQSSAVDACSVPMAPSLQPWLPTPLHAALCGAHTGGTPTDVPTGLLCTTHATAHPSTMIPMCALIDATRCLIHQILPCRKQQTLGAQESYRNRAHDDWPFG